MRYAVLLVAAVFVMSAALSFSLASLLFAAFGEVLP